MKLIGKEKEFLSVWMILFENGSDPTWLPNEKEDSSSKNFEEMALFVLFQRLIPLLLITERKHGRREREMGKGIIRGFCQETLESKDKRKRNVLHAIFDCDWNYIKYYEIGDVTSEDGVYKSDDEFLRLLQDLYDHILREIPEVSLKKLIDETDCDEKTPLHCFINIVLPLIEGELGIVQNIISMLRSEENIKALDKEGRNALQTLFLNFTQKEELRTVWEIILSLRPEETTSGEILLLMIQKAGIVLGSELYSEIIQVL